MLADETFFVLLHKTPITLNARAFDFWNARRGRLRIVVTILRRVLVKVHRVRLRPPFIQHIPTTTMTMTKAA